VKYSPDGATVRIWCQLIDAPTADGRQNSESHASAATKKMVEIRVSDQGPGIADDMKAAIFERFKQADQRRDRKSGFGLGLNICKTIIERHNGIIGVDSKAGQGSVFWFAVPLETRDQEG
jgi:signal transduction histidine kinase